MNPSQQCQVPIKTWLAPEVYRALEKLATERGTTVGVLVALAARQALTPRREKRKYVRMTPERFQRLCELSRTRLGVQEIADRLGVSRATVDNHIQRARSTT